MTFIIRDTKNQLTQNAERAIVFPQRKIVNNLIVFLLNGTGRNTELFPDIKNETGGRVMKKSHISYSRIGHAADFSSGLWPCRREPH